MKKRLYGIILAAAAGAFAAGCSSSEQTGDTQGDGPIVPVDFSMTRATEPITDVVAFRMLAYDAGEIEPAYLNETFDVTVTRKIAYGTYRNNTPNERNGSLIPCAVDANGVPVAPDDLTSAEGLLLHLGEYGRDRDYDIYMFTPALSIVNNGLGSFRIKYFRDNHLKMSEEPFTITNSLANYLFSIPKESQVFEDVIAKFHFDFIQGNDDAFKLEDAKMLYVGEYALYHPALKINQIVNQADPDTDAPTTAAITLVDQSNSTRGEISYKTAENNAVAIFPNDYTLETVSELVLSFVLKIGPTQARLNVPIALDVKPRTNYRFHISVTSTLIDVSYTYEPWVQKNLPDESGSGGFKLPIGTYPVGEWNEGYNDTEIIG